MKIVVDTRMSPEQFGESVVAQMKAQGVALSPADEAYLKTPMDLSQAKTFGSLDALKEYTQRINDLDSL